MNSLLELEAGTLLGLFGTLLEFFEDSNSVLESVTPELTSVHVTVRPTARSTARV